MQTLSLTAVVVTAMGLACTPGGSSGTLIDAGVSKPTDRSPVLEKPLTFPVKRVIGAPVHEPGFDIETLNALDTDGDGVPDGDDNCPNTANPNQADQDGDEFGDVCEPQPLDVDTATTLSVSPTPVRVGQPLTITLNVRNVGNAPATFIVATLRTGIEFSFESLTASQGKCVHDEWGNLRCQLGDLAVSASATISVVCIPHSTGSPKLEALGVTETLDHDANLGNDTPTLRLTILP
ncbi:thrombospondin type 3 repeat-containing protein [Corallococcus caeni]